MSEYLHDYAQLQRQGHYQQPHTTQSDLHHTAQQVPMYAGLALSLLALFFSGGSAAVCTSFMLANIGVGAISCGLYTHTALTANDVALRKRAWTNALMGLIFTALGAGRQMAIK